MKIRSGEDIVAKKTMNNPFHYSTKVTFKATVLIDLLLKTYSEQLWGCRHLDACTPDDDDSENDHDDEDDEEEDNDNMRRRWGHDW